VLRCAAVGAVGVGVYVLFMVVGGPWVGGWVGGWIAPCFYFPIKPLSPQPPSHLTPKNQTNKPTKQFLVSRGASLEDEDVAQRTALFWAIQYGRTEVSE
jgi:hypothetical protein